jgi:hypothetical protein
MRRKEPDWCHKAKFKNFQQMHLSHPNTPTGLRGKEKNAALRYAMNAIAKMSKQKQHHSAGGTCKRQWMMTAAARSEKLPIRLMAEAPRNMRSNLGRRKVLVCAWVMYQERAVPPNDACLVALFQSVAAKRRQAVGRRSPVGWKLKPHQQSRAGS